MAKVNSRNIIGSLIKTAVMNQGSYNSVRRLTTTFRAKIDMRYDIHGMKYELLSKQRIEEAATLVTEELTKHNPMNRHLRIPYEIYNSRNRAMLEGAMENGIVTCAFDALSNKMVGIGTFTLISSLDQFEYLLDPIMCDEFSPVRLLNRKLMEMFFNLDEVRELQSQGQQFLSIDTGSMKAGYQKTGLATHFINWAVDIARAKDVIFAIGRSSNLASQMLYTKLIDFQTLGEIVYRDFEINGEKPFDNIDIQCESAKIFIRRLQLDQGMKQPI